MAGKISDDELKSRKDEFIIIDVREADELQMERLMVQNTCLLD